MLQPRKGEQRCGRKAHRAHNVKRVAERTGIGAVDECTEQERDRQGRNRTQQPACNGDQQQASMRPEPRPEPVANAGRPPTPGKVRARLQREYDPGVQPGELLLSHQAVALCRIVDQEIAAAESLQYTEVLELPEKDRRSADTAQVAVRQSSALEVDSEEIGRPLQVRSVATVATDAASDPQFIDRHPPAVVRQHDSQRRRPALPDLDLLDGRRLAPVNDNVPATPQPLPDGVEDRTSHRDCRSLGIRC